LAPGGTAIDVTGYDTIEFEAKGSGKFNVLLEQPIVTDWDNYVPIPSWPRRTGRTIKSTSQASNRAVGKTHAFSSLGINAFASTLA